MSSLGIQRLEINGRAATAEDLRFPALVNYGHFTAMQVRDGLVRGMDLHLARLDAANRELFGAELDGTRVRELIRHALGTDYKDASVRVIIHRPDDDGEVSIMVTVRPPALPPSVPKRLCSVRYARPVPHIKHLGGFGQMHYGLLAERAGFDEALLLGDGDVVAEGAITNIGFVEDGTVVWPDAPMLHGIAMQLLERALAGRGTPSRRRTVRLSDLGSFDATFVTNSHGVARVTHIDDRELVPGTEHVEAITHLYESTPWDEI